MDRAIIVMMILVAVDTSMFVMQLILLPFKADELTLDSVQMGYVATTFALSRLIGNPIFGRICDRVSVRTSFLITFTSWAILLFSASIASSFPTLILSRIPAMFCLGIQATQAGIPKIASGAKRDSAMGRITMAIGIGVIAGPLLGSAASSLFGNSWAFLSGSVVCIAMLILVMKELPGDTASSQPPTSEAGKTEKPSKGIRGTLHDYARVLEKPQVGTLMLIKAICTAPHAVQNPIISLYLVKVLKVTPGQNAMLAGYMGVLMILVAALLVPQVQKHLSVRSVIQISSALIMYTYGGMCFFSSFYQLFLINPGYMIANALAGSISDATLGALVSKSESGTCFGLSNSMISLIGIVAPVFGGYMNRIMGFSFIIYFGVLTAAAVYSLSWRIPVDLRKAEKD